MSYPNAHIDCEKIGHYWQHHKYTQDTDGVIWKNKKAYWECAACKKRLYKRPKDLLDDTELEAFKTWAKKNLAPKKKLPSPAATTESKNKTANKKKPFPPHIITFFNKGKRGYFKAILPEGGTRFHVSVVPGRSLASVFTNEAELWDAREQVAKDYPSLAVSVEPLDANGYEPPPTPIKVPKPANLRPLDLD